MPLLAYSVLVIEGLHHMVEGLRGDHPLGVVVGSVAFLLSLIWLITTINSPVPVSRHDFGVRFQAALWTLMAYEIAHTVAAR